jgi:hypothetical protein
VDKDDGMRKVTAAVRPGIKEMAKGHKPGDLLARLDIDPYERSFWNSSTHILAPRLDEPTLRAALKAGHAYVAHDWMCEATGFRFTAVDASGKVAAILGDELKYGEGLSLSADFPVPCQTRLLRDGSLIVETSGKEHTEFPVREPGTYRLEAWLSLDGELRPWIFANPIYIR